MMCLDYQSHLKISVQPPAYVQFFLLGEAICSSGQHPITVILH